MRRLVVVGLLLSLLAPPAGAARFLIRCKEGAAQADIRRRPAGVYRRTYPACVAATVTGCVFGFCPSLERVVGCVLGPHCAAAVKPCTGPDDGELFAVKPGRRLRIRLGRDRVVLRCAR